LLFACSDVESEIKSTDTAEVRERKESNIRTRAAMASLRARMDQSANNKVSRVFSLIQSKQSAIVDNRL